MLTGGDDGISDKGPTAPQFGTPHRVSLSTLARKKTHTGGDKMSVPAGLNVEDRSLLNHGSGGGFGGNMKELIGSDAVKYQRTPKPSVRVFIATMLWMNQSGSLN